MIDLNKIDWNMTFEDFQKVEKDLQDNFQLQKVKKKLHNEKNVYIRGNYYNLDLNTYNRLKSLKSQASRDKLIEDIIKKFEPITSII